MSLSDQADLYLTGLREALDQVDRPALWAMMAVIMRAWREQRLVLVFGNGGSAGLASHMATDLSKVVVPGQARLRALSLTDNVPVMTAWANDTTYDNIFAEQLINLCQPGDVVIAVSCSGNSRNVLRGVEVAHEIGATVLALTGDSGGRLREMADVCVCAPAADIETQEDVHLAVNHLIATTLRTWIGEIARRSQQPPQALVLAAGGGTRLGPLTANLPKPMVEIDGRPLLEHTLGWLSRYGVREIAVNLHHCPEAISDYFGDGSAQGVRLHYSYEAPVRGTAGAIAGLDGFLSGGPLLVVYGDVLTDLDLSRLLRFHYQNAAIDPAMGATLGLYHVDNPTEVGLVGLDAGGRITRFLEKPRPEEVFTDLANAGVLVVEPAAVPYIPRDTYYDFGQHLLPRLLAGGVNLYGWVVPPDTYLLDIGTPEKYAQARREWPGRQSRRAKY